MIDDKDENEFIGRTEFDSPEVDNIVRVIGNTEIGSIEKVKITEASEFELSGSIINSNYQ